jgi:protease-4
MVVQAKKAGKKLVVSMGATAASGGYWIAADADKIVADPGTLTGSIGVFSGKFVVTKGLGDLGVTFDSTQAGPFAALNSPFTPYTPEQSQRLNALLDQIYGGFVARVAEGRKLPPATVAQSAKGRVWTGQQAKQLGLVDELGGLSDAIRVARDLAGIAADQVRLTVLPKPLSPLETLQQVLNGNVRSDDALLDLEETAEGPAGAMVRALAPLFRSPADARLRMPDPGIQD